MPIDFYQIDSFADEVFAGNPAGVCPLSNWLADGLMQKIAMENNLSETAFIVPGADHTYQIRWFTPTDEVDLCGHATLAAAWVIFQKLNFANDTISFTSKSGLLKVKRLDEDWLEMDFPKWPYSTKNHADFKLCDGITEAYQSTDLMFVLEREEDVRNYRPDFSLLQKLSSRCVILTAPAEHDDVDFVSRVFCPAVGVPEDPVTGSSHCMIIPYWTDRLGKDHLIARQMSKRGGLLRCRSEGDRVFIAGKAVLYLQGTLAIEGQA